MKLVVPLGIGTLFRRFSWQLEIIFLDFFHAPFHAGIFAALLRIFQPFQQFSQVVSSVFLPFLVRHRRRYLYILIVICVVSIGCILALFCYLFSSYILDILGKDYHLPYTIKIFKILLFLVPFVIVIPFLFSMLVSLNQEKRWIFINFFIFILNSVLSCFLISMWRLSGAALSRIITELFLSLSLIIFLLRSKK